MVKQRARNVSADESGLTTSTILVLRDVDLLLNWTYIYVKW